MIIVSANTSGSLSIVTSAENALFHVIVALLFVPDALFKRILPNSVVLSSSLLTIPR